jgi:hypothetical protein
MGPVRYSWLEACNLALKESDPKKIPSHIELAITALEQRYAKWGGNPGTSVELNAIRWTIVALEEHAVIARKTANPEAARTGRALNKHLGHVSARFVVLRPSSL